ncbi:uncharacterized protein LOC132309503 [Cornus florida]|uniref:uncharacterized protein LOC132309503 n=1 Tax=Cornus florida TaxID=4283 RepID=UPI0028A013D5|nr:uncharacterized protein LOC132309503 [Cornus florida]
MTKYFDTIKFQQIPREENPIADRLANAVSLGDESLTRVVPINVLETPSITRGVQVLVIPWEPSWIDPILAYLERGELSNSKEAARQLRMKAAIYSVVGGQLFRRSHFGPYLKCLTPTESREVLKQIHEEEYGNHFGAGRWLIKLSLKVIFGPTWQGKQKNTLADATSVKGIPPRQLPPEDIDTMSSP